MTELLLKTWMYDKSADTLLFSQLRNALFQILKYLLHDKDLLCQPARPLAILLALPILVYKQEQMV